MPGETKKEKLSAKVRADLARRRKEQEARHKLEADDRRLIPNYRNTEDAFWDPLGWTWHASPEMLTERPWELPTRFPALRNIRAPLADVEDRGTEFVVTAEMPGVPKDDIDVTVTGDRVEIRAKTAREEEETGKAFRRRERTFREFHRRLALPEDVRPDAAEARLENGLLTIRLPKKEPTPAEERHKLKIQ